jgi:hypothetical protein
VIVTKQIPAGTVAALGDVKMVLGKATAGPLRLTSPAAARHTDAPMLNARQRTTDLRLSSNEAAR